LAIRLWDGSPFAFAGLWERWERADGMPVETCAILTTQANERVRPIHERMPVILRPDHYDAWLDPSVQQAEVLQPLLAPSTRQR
jgi:putative SOS response-associated peptidase YedK